MGPFYVFFQITKDTQELLFIEVIAIFTILEIKTEKCLKHAAVRAMTSSHVMWPLENVTVHS